MARPDDDIETLKCDDPVLSGDGGSIVVENPEGRRLGLILPDRGTRLFLNGRPTTSELIIVAYDLGLRVELDINFRCYGHVEEARFFTKRDLFDVL